jgi:hypothetical protein
VHLIHIFAKLGISTRAELAARAISQELTGGHSQNPSQRRHAWRICAAHPDDSFQPPAVRTMSAHHDHDPRTQEPADASGLTEADARGQVSRLQ